MTTQQFNIPFLLLDSGYGYGYRSNVNITGNLTVTNSMIAGNIGIGTIVAQDKLVVYGNIIPSSCNVYDLGTSNLRFRDLYLSGTSIDLGGILITRNSNQDGIDVKTSSTATLQFKPPIKKLAYRQSNTGTFITDGIAYIDSDDNACVIGNSTNYRFGYYDIRSPATIIYLPNNEKAAEITATTDNTYILTKSGTVYSIGNNSFGQAALSAGASSSAFPTPTLSAISNCKKICVSTDENPVTVYFLTNDGKIYAAGNNQYGQIGNGNTTNTLADGPLLTLGPGNTYGNPTTIVTDIVNIGSYNGTNYPHTGCALLSNGTVYCTGYGGQGQIGNGGTANVSVWTQVLTGVGTPLTNVVQISGSGEDAGTSFYAINSSGALYVWGYNGNGQLGVGDTTRRTYATLATTNVSKLWAVRSGNNHSTVYIQNTNGLFYGTGYNNYGQLGLGNTTQQTSFTLISSLSNKNITDLFISCGRETHVLAKSSDNKLYAAGRNTEGQLGLFHVDTPVTTFTEVPFYSPSPIKDCFLNYTISVGGMTLILTEDGQTYFTGRTRYEFAGNSDRNIAAFSRNTFYLTGKAL